MRFQESVHKARQGLALILVGLTICGLLMVASICLAAGDEWAEKRDMPTARRSHSTSAVKGKIYAIAGKVGTNAADECLSTVEEYNPATDTWTKKADMPTARMLPSASAVNGKIYTIGGLLLPDWTPVSVVEVYDPATDTWASRPDMPIPREAPTSVVNGRIYAIGGGPLAGPPVSTVEEYTPEGWPFAVSPQGKLTTMWGSVKRSR